jgi:hypothetical protein
MPVSRRRALKAGAALGLAVATGGGAGSVLAQAPELVQKRIPKSGEALPPVGIGTNRYGVGESEAERAPLRDTMARFVELGGKVIDTAMIYGTSEAVIGDLAQSLGIRERLFLATKTDIRGRVQGEEGLQNALARLKTDMIDAMLVHNLVNAATELPVMREWQRQGKLRYIGASISTHDQFDEMERFMRDNDVEIVQFNYSLAARGGPRHRRDDQRAVRRRPIIPARQGRGAPTSRLRCRVRLRYVGAVFLEVHRLPPRGDLRHSGYAAGPVRRGQFRRGAGALAGRRAAPTPGGILRQPSVSAR